MLNYDTETFRVKKPQHSKMSLVGVSNVNYMEAEDQATNTVNSDTSSIITPEMRKPSAFGRGSTRKRATDMSHLDMPPQPPKPSMPDKTVL